MRDRIRWGILATGAIATQFVSDLRLLPDAEVVAVGSRTTTAAEAFAARHGIPRAYGSWQELAADPDLDVIYVATPHSAHFEATMTCLAAGRATLTEKPFTLDLATAQCLVSTARDAGVFLMEAMWTRCFPAIRQLNKLIADGAIGEVTNVQAAFGLAGPFPATSRLVDPTLGGGALLDLGVYPVTIAHLFLGAPMRSPPGPASPRRGSTRTPRSPSGTPPAPSPSCPAPSSAPPRAGPRSPAPVAGSNCRRTSSCRRVSP